MTTDELDVDRRLEKIAGKVGRGRNHRTTPRDLLELFGAKRRGVNIVAEIRSRLARHNLKTSPDFADVHVDEWIEYEIAGKQPRHVSRLEEADKRLRDGRDSSNVTVRELLRWFGFERRGPQVCELIRASLAGFDLTTAPDFENTPIDAEVSLVRRNVHVSARDASSTEEQQGLDDESTLQQQTMVSTEHALFRIGALPEARRDRHDDVRELVSIGPETSLRKAMSVMLARQISYLPVLRNERSITGVLRWKDIGKYLLMMKDAQLDDPVERAMSQPREVRVNEPFLRVIPEIIQHGSVLVRDEQRRLSGIVTKKDLGRRLQDLAGPFVTLGEIERCLRALIERGEFTASELHEIAVDPRDARAVASVADLSLGEYQRLLEHEEAWRRVGIALDKRAFLAQLQEVRRVRNNVMHFDPESPTAEDRRVLKEFLELAYELRRHSESS